MSVLSRVNWIPQQRVDLSHLLASESYTAFDLRSILSILGGITKPYVVRGLFASTKTGLTLSFNTADALVINPQDNVASFYAGLADDADILISLPANQSNIFIEGRFVTQTGAPAATGIWDPLALSGEDASGDEFSEAADSQDVTVFEISVNTIEFSDGAVPLAFASTDASSITGLQDWRDLLFRLGRPSDPLFKYGFSTSRGEPPVNGTGTGESSTTSPWLSQDATGTKNDKGFKNLKDWADAVMTRISEVSGSALWWQSGASTSSVANLSLSELYFDTIGHSIQPQANASFIWKTTGGGLRLCGEGDVALSGGARQIGLVRWQANNTGLQWHLGATFTGGGFRSYSDVRFESPIPADGGNVYLAFERDVIKGSGNSVLWADNSSYTPFTAAKTVSGQSGDFTGIALGDYIRKASEGTSKYYLVQKMSDGTNVYQNTGTEQNKIADATIIAVELVDINDPSGNISGASEEPLRYFRSHYDEADLVANTTVGTYTYQDANYYWLGRRVGDLFYLRDYGNMQEGEETPTTEDSWPVQGGGDGGLFLQHATLATYNQTTGYKLYSGSGTLLTIGRRRQNNSIESPGSGDNTNGWLEYTIASPVGNMSLGDGLWVRLSDTTSGALSNGSVTDATDAVDNTATTDNRWEVRSQANNVLRTWDTRNVFLVARRIDIVIDGSTLAALQFTNGSVVCENGLTLNNKTQITTFTFGTNHSIDTTNTTSNISLFSSLGAAEVRIGGVNSTTRIYGDLIVNGNMTAIQTTQIQADDKLITLGVGLLVDEAYNAGIEIVDDTKTATQFSTTLGSSDVLITFNTGDLAGYSTGDEVGISAGDGLGGISAGQIGGVYTIVSTLTTVGQATISGDQMTIRTSGTATSSVGSPSNAPRLFKSPWSIKVGAADGTYTGVTSWVFRVKGTATAPAITPVSGYSTVPTADATNMAATRIPFTGNDGAGSGASDSTLNFSSNLIFDSATNKLTTANLKTTQGAELTVSVVKTADYTLTTQDITVPFNTSAASADVIATLPAATGSGRVYVVKDVGGVSSSFNKNIIVTPTGADTIDGDVNYIIRHNFEGLILQDIAAGEWYIITKTAGGSSGTILVDLYDPLSTTLPTGVTATIDGVAVADDDKVFFTNLSTGNEEIYQASGVGVSITWSPLPAFADDQFVPAAGETVRAIKGVIFANQLILKTAAGEYLINDTVRYFDGDKGTDFWEQSSIKTTTLADATTAGEVFSVTAAGSENFIVSYSIVRGSGQKETGEIYITSDGVTAQIAQSNAYLTDTGVTFDATITVGNLKLLYDSTSTGTAATMKYFVRRWSDSPGGPSGVPSYSTGGGSPVSAAGTTGDVQYKGSSGNLDADASFKWDASEQAINLNGLLIGKLNGPSVLLDNQAVPVVVFSYPVANKWTVVEYSLERDGNTQIGRLLLTNNGTITSISDDSTSTILSLGVTFSSDISGGSQRVLYSTTATGFNTSFKYSTRKWQ